MKKTHYVIAFRNGSFIERYIDYGTMFRVWTVDAEINARKFNSYNEARDVAINILDLYKESGDTRPVLSVIRVEEVHTLTHTVVSSLYS